MGGASYQSAPPAFLQQIVWRLLNGTVVDLEKMDSGVTGEEGWLEIDSYSLANNPPWPNPSADQFNVVAKMQEAATAPSPYETSVAYDPTDDLEAIQAELQKYAGLADEDTWLVDAITDADTLLGTDASGLDAKVNAFEARQAPAFARAVNRLTASVFDANATTGTALTWGLMLLEMGRQSDLGAYLAEQTNAQDAARAEFIFRVATAKATLRQNAYAAWAEFYTKKIVAQKEYSSEELERVLKSTLWDLELFHYGVSVIGALNGAPSMVPGQSKMQSALNVALGVGSIFASLAAA